MDEKQNAFADLREGTASPEYAFTVVGFAALAVTVCLQLLPLGIDFIIMKICPDILNYSWYPYVLQTVIETLIIIPAVWLITRLLPSVAVTKKFSITGRVFKYFLMIYFPGILLSGISNIIMMQFSALKGSQIQNPLTQMITGNNMWQTIIFLAVIAPVLEEIIFRGLLLSRLRPYGSGAAIFFTSFIFALTHGNLFQMLYAFAIGAVFGAVVIKTGRLSYSIALHIIFNIAGTVLPMMMISDSAAVSVISILIYAAVFISSIIVFVISIIKKEFPLTKDDIMPKRYIKPMLLNPGTLIFTAFSAFLVIYQMVI